MIIIKNNSHVDENMMIESPQIYEEVRRFIDKFVTKYNTIEAHLTEGNNNSYYVNKKEEDNRSQL